MNFNKNKLLIKGGFIFNNYIKKINNEIKLPVYFTNIWNILSVKFLFENQIGRWKISNNEKIISIKVNQANEDHCGCCNIKEQNNKKDDYYSYFCS
jgi:predicted transcriptional regulator